MFITSELLEQLTSTPCDLIGRGWWNKAAVCFPTVPKMLVLNNKKISFDLPLSFRSVLPRFPLNSPFSHDLSATAECLHDSTNIVALTVVLIRKCIIIYDRLLQEALN